MRSTRVDAAERRSGADILVLGVRAPARGEDTTNATAEVRPDDQAEAMALGIDLGRRLARVRATGRRGELTWIDLEGDSPVVLAVLGLGKGTPADLRAAGAALARRARGNDSAEVLVPGDLTAEHVRALSEGIVLGGPLPTAATSTSPVSVPLGEVRLITTMTDAGVAVACGVAHAEASMRARRLVQTPSNRKGPDWLAEQAIALSGPVLTRSLGVEDLARLGMGGLLGVGGGSARPPRLVTLGWAPPDVGADDLRHVVLVGKGITFDSGGISLKPPEMQIPMKTDMTGAAVVTGVISALSELGVRGAPGVRVTGLLCLAENLPGASALRPGDVVRHHGGLTSEVLNTDAEGRLVLGDGLAWAVGELRADVVIDVATLTGAATLGLGRTYGALFANRPGLADALREAGRAAGEPLWQLPLHESYRELISSEVADQANADATPGPGPGAITAALFLQRFVGGTPWAHLDVAGPARSDSERLDVPKGGTGFGVRALLRWLEAGART